MVNLNDVIKERSKRSMNIEPDQMSDAEFKMFDLQTQKKEMMKQFGQSPEKDAQLNQAIDEINAQINNLKKKI